MPRTRPLQRLLVWIRRGYKAMGVARLVSHPLYKVNKNKQYHHSILPTFKAACPLAGKGEGAGHRFRKGEREKRGLFFQ